MAGEIFIEAIRVAGATRCAADVTAQLHLLGMLVHPANSLRNELTETDLLLFGNLRGIAGIARASARLHSGRGALVAAVGSLMGPLSIADRLMSLVRYLWSGE